MHPKLLDYYNRELVHVRDMAAEFAEEFPRIARRLGIEGHEVADPYVERLLEGFAFVASRIQLKLDAEFPRFTQHLLEILFPNALAPSPSMAVVAFEPRRSDPALAEGYRIDRHAELRSASNYAGQQTPCRFRTVQATTLWPIEVVAARCFDAAPDLPIGALGLAREMRSGLRITLRCHPGFRFDKLPCDGLSFYIDAADDIAGQLHALVHSRCLCVAVVSGDVPHRLLGRLEPGCIAARGLEDENAALPSLARSMPGAGLLREYFEFPARFGFFDVSGLRPTISRQAGDTLELVMLFDQAAPALTGAIKAENLRLNAAPVVNLFPMRADRIHVDDGVSEHHLVPDRSRPMDFEVFAITSMRGIGESSGDEIVLRPMYGSLVHDGDDAAPAFYTTRREPRRFSARQQRQGSRSGYVGTEVYLSIVDHREAPYPGSLRQLAPGILATNRDLPLLLPMGNRNMLMLADPGAVQEIAVLKGPSRPRSAISEGDEAWRLISQLSLNHVSLLGGDEAGVTAAAALRELLLLHADPQSAGHRRRIEALRAVRSQPVIRRLPMPGPIAFGRGLQIDIEVDESAFGGDGAYLFGSVLERYLARHVAINTFTETRLLASGRGEIARWQARSGTQPIA